MSRRKPIRQYIAERVDVRDMGYRTPCWVWKLKPARQGYARSMMKVDGVLKPRFIHRLAYEEYVGPIPEELSIDHLCRVRLCCNPDHLEAVPIAVNIKRAVGLSLLTHCKRGHELTPENTYTNSQGNRACLPCKRYLGTRAWRDEKARMAR